MKVTDLVGLSAAAIVGLSAPVGAMAADPASGGQLLEQRVDRLERVVDSRMLMQLQTRIDELQQEVSELRGQLEQQDHAMETLKQRQRELYLDTDRRLRELEVRGPAPEQASEKPDAQPSDAQSSVAEQSQPSAAGDQGDAPADPGAVQHAYDEAFALLKEGRYQEAIAAFDAFLANHGATDYADNAQYWKGEAFYVTQAFDKALEAFGGVLEAYPESAKVPDALLKMGYTHYELDNMSKAKTYLQRVVDEAPSSSAARLAQRRLDKIAGEGQ